jgi:DNA-binding transcriptional ArsR family regulator
MLDPEKIKKALIVDEAKLQEELLERVKQHVRIDNRGRVYILDPTRYRLKDLIALYLIGRAYAAEAKLIKDDAAELSEIARDIGGDYRVVSARLAELRNEGKVEAPARGQSRIVFARVPQILNEIEKPG